MRAVDLLDGAGPDDRRGHDRVVEQPRERDVGRRRADLGAQLLPRFELRALRLDLRLHAVATASTTRGTVGEDAAEQPAAERAPRDDADAVVGARGEHFELDRPRVEVVEALLRHETE